MTVRMALSLLVALAMGEVAAWRALAVSARPGPVSFRCWRKLRMCLRVEGPSDQ